MATEKPIDVIGLGSTIMDFLIEIEEHKFLKYNLKKGEMHLVEEHKAKELLQQLENQDQNQNQKIEIVPGGSSANTIKSIALLGGQSILCGKVGQDKHGEIYIQKITEHGVNSRINKHPTTTGHALTFITPDSERTFSVFLGAAITLEKTDILETDIEQSKILHLEGYQLEGPTKETIIHAIELAKKHNTKISIDLSDPGVIRRNKEFLKEIIFKHADIIFLNEQEAHAYTGLDPEAAIKELSSHAEIAIVKTGKSGSLIYNKKDNKITKISPYSADVIDTTGAGDTYAAGFLYGYCNNWPTEKSGQLGSLLAAKIIEIKGVRSELIDFKQLKNTINPNHKRPPNPEHS